MEEKTSPAGLDIKIRRPLPFGLTAALDGMATKSGDPGLAFETWATSHRCRLETQTPSSTKSETISLVAEGPASDHYQRKPKVTGNIPTVPVPMLLAELVGASTQT
jgi:hypothetical protein